MHESSKKATHTSTSPPSVSTLMSNTSFVSVRELIGTTSTAPFVATVCVCTEESPHLSGCVSTCAEPSRAPTANGSSVTREATPFRRTPVAARTRGACCGSIAITCVQGYLLASSVKYPAFAPTSTTDLLPSHASEVKKYSLERKVR